MKVYGHPMSTCTRKVLTTLAEKGREAELVTVDIMKGEHKKPEYLALHPFGVVPVLQDEDFVLYESRAIIRYLDARLPGVALTPKDVRAMGRMEQWISVEHSNFTPHAMKIIMQNLFAPMSGKEPDLDIVNKARGDCERVLDVMERHLAKHPYLAGEAFSLAEITLQPYVDYLFAAKSGDLVTARPAVSAWWSNISVRPSWLKVTGKAK